MKAYLVLIVVLAVAAAVYAFSGSASQKAKGPTWEYKQLATMRQSLHKPSVDENGDFSEKETEQVRKGIAYVNDTFGKEFQQKLAQAGREGWELVSVTSASNESETVMTTESTAYLKRQMR